MAKKKKDPIVEEVVAEEAPVEEVVAEEAPVEEVVAEDKVWKVADRHSCTSKKGTLTPGATVKADMLEGGEGALAKLVELGVVV